MKFQTNTSAQKYSLFLFLPLFRFLAPGLFWLMPLQAVWAQQGGILIKGAAQLTLKGNITISTRGDLGGIKIGNGTNLTVDGSGTLKLEGNLQVNGNFAAGNGTLIFSGSRLQNIYSASNPLELYNLTFQKSGGAKADATQGGGVSLRINHQLQLDYGRLLTSATHPLILSASALPVSGGNAASFVEGTIKIEGNAGDAPIPLGKDTKYAPLSLKNRSGGTSTDFFLVSYHTTAGPLSGTFSGGINRVFPHAYWEVERSGNVSAQLTLRYDELQWQDFGISDPLNLRLAGLSSGTWEKITSAPTGNTEQGSLSSTVSAGIDFARYRRFTFGNGNSGGNLFQHGDIYFWVGSTANWHSAANWSFTPRAAGGAGIPNQNNADAVIDNFSAIKPQINSPATVRNLLVTDGAQGLEAGNKLKVEKMFIQEGGTVEIPPSGSLELQGDALLKGGTFTANGQVILSGRGKFAHNHSAAALVQNLKISGVRTLANDLTVGTTLTLGGKVINPVAKLLVGNGSSATMQYGGGSVSGKLGYWLDAASNNLFFPLSGRQITLTPKTLNTAGKIFMHFQNTNPNPITAFVDGYFPVTALFNEGFFRLQSEGADFNFDVRINKTLFNSFPIDKKYTRIVVRNHHTTVWEGEGDRIKPLYRRGLRLSANKGKDLAPANQCSDLVVSAALDPEKSDTLACSLKEIRLVLLGANLDKDEFYRFYDEKGYKITHKFIQDGPTANRFYLADSSLLGKKIAVVVAHKNGCESIAKRNTFRLDIAPPPTSPAVEKGIPIQAAEGDSLLIRMKSQLKKPAQYVLMAADTVVKYRQDTTGNLLLDSLVFKDITFGENNIFEGKFFVFVKNSEGCHSDTLEIPFKIVRHPEVKSRQATDAANQGQAIGFCEGEMLRIAMGKKQFKRERYLILSDEKGENKQGKDPPNKQGEAEKDTLSEVTASFQKIETDDEVFFERKMPPGVYTYHLTLEDTTHGVRGKLLKLKYVVHKKPELPTIDSTSVLVAAHKDDLQITLAPLKDSSLLYRWYENKNDDEPFLTHKKNRLTLSPRVSISKSVNKGIYFLEKYHEKTGCASKRKAVPYFVLKYPKKPEFSADKIAVCQGDSVKNILPANLKAVPQDGLSAKLYLVRKGGELLFKDSLANFAYLPAASEDSGRFEISVLDSFTVAGKKYALEGAAAEFSFHTIKSPKIGTLVPVAQSCDALGGFRMQVLPGSAASRDYLLEIAAIAGGDTTNLRQHRATANSNGEITVGRLPAGAYKLTVRSSEITDGKGKPCHNKDTTSFIIPTPRPPKFLGKRDSVVSWQCGSINLRDVPLDSGDVSRLSYLWLNHDGDTIGTEKNLFYVKPSKTYRLIIGEYQDKNTEDGKTVCARDTLTLGFDNSQNFCGTLISEDQLNKLCAFKNSLPKAIQLLLRWSDCPSSDTNADNWPGVILDKDGFVVGLNLENLSLQQVDAALLRQFSRLKTLFLGGNALDFSALEKLLPRNIFAKAQEPIGQAYTKRKSVGQSVSFEVPKNVAGKLGKVSWYFIKKGKSEKEAVKIGEGKKIVRTNLKIGKDEGQYFAKITHPKFPGLVVLRKKITLKVLPKMIAPDRATLHSIFEHFPDLFKTVDLGGAATDWPGVKQEGDRCVELNLSSLKLEGEIPAEIGKLTALEKLSFFNNKLSGSIPKSIGKLKALTFLDLDKNNLSGIVPDSITALSKLKTLWLSRNKFTGLPENFGKLKQLTHLFLHENQLTRLPAGLGKMPKLVVLNLSNNLLNTFLSGPKNYPQLTHLDLSNNQINKFRLSSSSFPALKTLNLSDNNLTDLPVGIRLLRTLEKLWVRRNFLDFADLEPLKLSITAYSPQKRQTKDEEFFVYAGDSIRLSSKISGSKNTYRWFKNGKEIPASDSAGYTILQVGTQDAGRYECRASSSLVPNLSVLSRFMVLHTVCKADVSLRLQTKNKRNFCEGETIYVLIQAQSNRKGKFRWRKDGKLLPLSTESLYRAFSAGEYVAEMETDLGCFVRAEPLRIRLNKRPEISLHLAEGLLLEAKTTGNSEDIYWLKDGKKIEGVRGNTYRPTQNGLYQAALRNAAGCEGKSAVQHIEITALKPKLSVTSPLLYPNPTHGLLQIEFAEMQKHTRLILRSTKGKTILNRLLRGKKSTSFDLSFLPKGIYLLEIGNTSGKIIRKIAKF